MSGTTKGLPGRLKGERSITAQVVSIADVYDALTNERVYKPAYTHESHRDDPERRSAVPSAR